MEEDEVYKLVHLGTVANREDPEKRGRVQLIVPGIWDVPSPWAIPLGTSGGGSAQRGFYAVPEKDADVIVFFVGGDENHPAYLAGHWGLPKGQNEAPSYIAGLSKADAPNVRVFESKNFLLVFDDRGGNEQLLLKEKGANTVIRVTANKIELGGAGLVSATDGVVVASCVDPFTGATHGALNGASSIVLAKKV